MDISSTICKMALWAAGKEASHLFISSTNSFLMRDKDLSRLEEGI
jgi:hypothetical protein